MKTLLSFGGLLAVLLLAPAAPVSAEPNVITVTILATFDVGTGNLTTPYAINSRGDIVGYYTDPGITYYRGFIRQASGTIIAPIIEPNDNGNYTACYGINSSQTITGEFLQIGDLTAYHGFFLSRGVYTQYDINMPGFSTALVGLNDAGDFAGIFGNADQPNEAFISVGGNVTTFTVAGSFDTYASGINRTDQVAGYYDDQNIVFHGFFRDSNGAITAPIEPRGATYSLLLGINDSGIMVGRYGDASGGVHGMIFKAPRSFITYDYPGATETSINGINRNNMVTGRYVDSNGIRHGFLGQLSAH